MKSKLKSIVIDNHFVALRFYRAAVEPCGPGDDFIYHPPIN